MLKVASLILVFIGGIMLIINYWNDLGNLLSEEKGNENKFNFFRKLSLFFIFAGCICGVINIIFY